MVIPVPFQILRLVIPEVLMDTSPHVMDTSPRVATAVCFSFNPLPLTLSALTGKAGCSFCSFLFAALCVHKDIYHRSLQFLFSRLNNPTSFNLSKSDLQSLLLLSSWFTSFLKSSNQNCTQYWVPTNGNKSGRITSYLQAVVPLIHHDMALVSFPTPWLCWIMPNIQPALGNTPPCSGNSDDHSALGQHPACFFIEMHLIFPLQPDLTQSPLKPTERILSVLTLQWVMRMWSICSVRVLHKKLILHSILTLLHLLTGH